MATKTKTPELYYGPSSEKFYITDEDICQHSADVFNEEDWLKSEHVAYLCELWSLTASPDPEGHFGDITSPNIFVFAPYKTTGEEIYENPETLYDMFVQNAKPGKTTKIKGFGNALAAAKIMLDNSIVDLGASSAHDIKLQCEVVLHFSGSNPYVESIPDDEPWEWHLSYDRFRKVLSWVYTMEDTPKLWTKHVPFAYINSYAAAGVWEDDHIEGERSTEVVDNEELEELAADVVRSY